MQNSIFSLVSYTIGKDHPPENPNSDPRKLGISGILITIASISVLFLTSIIGYFWVRSISEAKGTWVPLGIRKIPDTLILSTMIIIMTSIFFHFTLGSFQKSKFSNYSKLLFTTFGLGLLFIIFQILAWREMMNLNFSPRSANLFSFTFYFLTALHAIHVIFGIVPFLKILYLNFRKEYTSAHGNLLLVTAIYWHFLDFIWLILFSVLYFF